MIKRLREWLHNDCIAKFEEMRTREQARYAMLEGANTHLGKQLADLKKEHAELKKTHQYEMDLSFKRCLDLEDQLEKKAKSTRTTDKNLQQYAQVFEALKKQEKSKNVGAKRRAANKA